MCRCNLNNPPSVPGDFCSCSRSCLRALFTLAVCGLRFAESGCGVGPSRGYLSRRRGALWFLPEGELDVTAVAEGWPCQNWSSVGVEREYVPYDVDGEVVDSVVMN